MKRVKIALLGVAAAAVITAGFGVHVSDGRIGFVAGAEARPCSSDTSGCTDPLAPTPSPTPDADPFAKGATTICVAVPVFANKNQGSCPKGEAEIVNDPGSGGAIVYYVKLVLELLNISIGGIIVLMLVIAGIQYIVSAADPNQVKNAKNRIQQAITALVLYLLMFAILSFLIPGGILG